MKQGDWFTLLLGFTGLVHYWEHKEHDMTPDPLTNVVPIAVWFVLNEKLRS